MRFDRWESGRTVVLQFHNQALQALNPIHATLNDAAEGGYRIRQLQQSGQVASTISFKLGDTATATICHSGHVTADGTFIRDDLCNDNGGSQPRYFSFQLMPAPAEQPDIICQNLAPPPPPPPAYVDTLRPVTHPSEGATPTPSTGTGTGTSHIGTPGDHASAPPPARQAFAGAPSPPTVHAAAACPSGGDATIQHASSTGDQQQKRIVVKPSLLWPTGYEYIVGLRGVQLKISQAVILPPVSAVSSLRLSLCTRLALV